MTGMTERLQCITPIDGSVYVEREPAGEAVAQGARAPIDPAEFRKKGSESFFSSGLQLAVAQHTQKNDSDPFFPDPFSNPPFPHHFSDTAV